MRSPFNLYLNLLHLSKFIILTVNCEQGGRRKPCERAEQGDQQVQHQDQGDQHQGLQDGEYDQ